MVKSERNPKNQGCCGTLWSMKRLKIYLGADHAGFLLKERIKEALTTRQLDVEDLSPVLQENDDYPLQAAKVVRALKKTKEARGIVVCGSGVGVAIAANRTKGIRAFDAHSVQEVELARNDEDANVITLSGWKISKKLALELIDTFLKTPASKAERHRRRIQQLG